MKIKETTAEMLAMCCTHIAIAHNMSSMDLSTHVVTVQNIKLLGQITVQQETPLAMLARRLVTGSRSVGTLKRPRMSRRNPNPSHNLIVELKEEEGQIK